MSLIISFHAFNAGRADEQWEQFDMVFDGAVVAERALRELRAKADALEPTEDEIYNPMLAEQKWEKLRALEHIHGEIARLVHAHPMVGTDAFHYFVHREPIAPRDVEDVFIQLDLAFGGITQSWNGKDSAAFLSMLRSLFPELDVPNDDNHDLARVTPVQWRTVFSDQVLLRDRYARYHNVLESALIRVTGGYPRDEAANVRAWMQELIGFLRTIKPVIKALEEPGTRLLVRYDSDPNRDPELVDRARAHVEVLRKKPAYAQVFCRLDH